jgi:hypothetical protein
VTTELDREDAHERGRCRGQGGDDGERGRCCGGHHSHAQIALSPAAEIARLELEIEASRARIAQLRRQ